MSVCLFLLLLRASLLEPSYKFYLVISLLGKQERVSDVLA